MNLLHKPTYSKIARAIGFAFVVSTTAGALAHAESTATSTGTSHQSTSRATMQPSIAASRLIGMEVQNRRGESLGEVIDLLIDSTDDKVEYAILSFGGLGNIGDKLFAYPLDRFDRTTARDPDKLVLNVSQAALENAPGFDRSLWPDFDRSEYRRKIERYYGQLSGSSDSRYLRASQMLDGDVKQPNGNDIGDVEDIAIGLDDGSVHYVVVEFEDGWVARGDLVAVPMKGFRSDDGDGTDLVYTATRQELSRAPSFDRDVWPDLVGNDEFNADIDRYNNFWSSADAGRG